MPILIAVNPYKNLKIYSDNNISFYKKYFYSLKCNPNDVEAPVPHLYHIAEAAYQDMINEKKNQSIIISGESGSGKTQSTKFILKYLAVRSNNANETSKPSKVVKEADSAVTVEKQVLDSNPLLEAFGNAKTVRNNNSSRFGKFIQVNFTDHGKILSARIYNYLLEKSRVVVIQPEERNYHIFYQLIRGADENEKKKHFIKDIEYFNYLNKGCFDVDETDDVANFIETKECMQKLKFKPEEMTYIFNILMGILYLGNVEFIACEKLGSPAAEVDPNTSTDFKFAAQLLGLSEDKLLAIMTIRKMRDPMNGGFFERYLSPEKAYGCRDAISKAVYAKMFDYIVNKVNKAIANKEELDKYDKNKIKKIGLLDIFGFENFDNNSFEQLCINYANERLQQFFNNHIFKLEQEEYKKEKIDWSQVEFVDNNNIIELIDAPKMSIFTLLDSEGIMPNSSDDAFRSKVYQYITDSDSLSECEPEFISIEHYAGYVDYYIYGFIEKNLDQLTPDILEALEKSKNKIIKLVFTPKKEEESTTLKKKNSTIGPSKLQSDSLSKQFKKQLDELMKMLSQSNPRYVKCIKPNPDKKPQSIHSAEVLEQLLSAGVLEAIKIRKQGYSIRRSSEEFVRRYHPLTPHIDIKTCEQQKYFKDALLEMMKLLYQNPDIKPYFELEKKLIQVGETKVFMKEEVKNILESKLSRIRYIVKIQSTFRAKKVYKRVKKYLRSVKKIQARWKGIKIRKFLIKLKKTTKLQKAIRFYFYKKRIFKHLKKLAFENIMRKEEERQKELQRLRDEEIKRLKEEEIKNRQNDIKEVPESNYNSNENNNLVTSFNMEEGIQASNNKLFNSNKKFKTNSKSTLARIERESSVSMKESLGDVSTSDVQLFNELNGLKSKQHKKISTKNTYADLLHYNLDTAHEEMKSKLEALTEELGLMRKDKESLLNDLTYHKEEVRRKEQELEILKNQNDANSLKAQLDNFETNVDKINTDINAKKNISYDTNSHAVNCDHIEELRRLKKEVADKEGYVDILNLKIDELTNSNTNLQSLNESLKDQLTKRTEKMNKEMDSLYSQIKDLEIKRSECENINRNLIIDKNNYNTNTSVVFEDKSETSIIIPKNDTKMLELKAENKNLNKKIDEIKSKYEKEISQVKNEVTVKETKIKETEVILMKIEKELKDKSDSYNTLKSEYDLCKDKIQDLKLKLDNLSKNSLVEYEQEINKMKIEFENSNKKKDSELDELKETVDLNAAQIDRLKKLEKALRSELNTKNDELSRRHDMLKEANTENDKLMDENLQIKKQNFSLSSKLELLEIDYKNKIENENKVRQNEIKQLKDKEKNYEKLIQEMKETLRKKQRIIEHKKEMNLMLVDLAKIKKGEIQCLESYHYTNSANLKETLIKIRENEKEVLSRLGEISANPDNTDSEDDGDYEEGEGDSDFESMEN